jgi:N-acetylmuramoyl-L-alanine amidase
MGSEVIYTRDKDEFVALEERTEIANRNRADLFLSIHANSSPLKAISGPETYYLNFTTSRTALDTATRENAASSKSVYELKDLLQKIALKDKVDESREFATRVQSALNPLTAPVVRTGTKQQQLQQQQQQRDRGIKKAPFIVLIGASMPSVLAEIGFLSNTKEELLLKRPEYRQKIAEALLKGIMQYEASLSHFMAQRKPAE